MLRFLKQTIVAAVFFAAIGLIFYFSLFKDAGMPVVTPTLSVQPPVIVLQKLLKISDFDYDFLAEIRNPNFDFGATEISYELNLFGQNGELVMARKGLVSLLPGQTRYELISPLIIDKEISAAEFKFIDVSWERLKEFIPQNLFSVRNQEFSPLPSGQSIIRATLFNDSNFDFDRVDVNVILFDRNDDVLAVNKTDIRTFLAKTNRFFEVKWPKPFEGEISRIEINAYTNVFKNENFIKEHGTQEKFQRFY